MTRIQKRFHISTGLVAAGFLLMLALAGYISSSAQKVPTPPRPIKNFGKVNDNFFRGSQPNQAQLAELKAMGVTTVIDLRKDFKPEERGWANELGMKYFNLPLLPGRAATKQQTEYFLSLVNDPANAPVYVHCKGGRHRTGAMTAAYRITHDGWTAEQAFEEMKKYDFEEGVAGGGPSSQKKFVFDFYEQHKNAATNGVTKE